MAVFLFIGKTVVAEEWFEEKGDHFVVEYTDKEDRLWMRNVLNRAEEFYIRISDQIGAPRYTNFWTFEDRVRIKMYRSKGHFMKKTGQPIWSVGGVKKDRGSLSTHTIMSYKQEEGFIDSVLPHEIGHLVLHDYIGKGNIPVWFDEGLAQTFESGKIEMAEEYLREYLKNNTHIPMTEFHTYRVQMEVNPLKVSLFYIQSVSMVNFLMKQYGASNFKRLNNYLRDGEEFESALRKAYLGSIDTLEELEKKWLSSMEY